MLCVHQAYSLLCSSGGWGQTVCFLPLLLFKKSLQQWALMCNKLCWACWQQWFPTEWHDHRWHLLKLHAYPGSLFYRIIPRCWEQLCCYMQEYYYSPFTGIHDAESHMPSAWVKLCSNPPWFHLQVIYWSGKGVCCISSVSKLMSFSCTYVLSEWSLVGHSVEIWGVTFNIFLVTFIHVHKMLRRHLQCNFRWCS